MTSEIHVDAFSVAGGMWTTIQQTSYRLGGCSTYVRKQLERHGWRQLTT